MSLSKKITLSVAIVVIVAIVVTVVDIVVAVAVANNLAIKFSPVLSGDFFIKKLDTFFIFVKLELYRI